MIAAKDPGEMDIFIGELKSEFKIVENEQEEKFIKINQNVNSNVHIDRPSEH